MEKCNGEFLGLTKERDINNKNVKSSRKRNRSKKRYPRAYRITLKKVQNNKSESINLNESQSSIDDNSNLKENNNESKTDANLDESQISSAEVNTDGASSSTENESSPTSGRKSRFVKFWSCSDVEALEVKTPEKTPLDTKKSKAANRRKNRNMRKKAENKEILDNILACIILMEENLSKFDADQDAVDSSKCVQNKDAPKKNNGNSKKKQNNIKARKDSKTGHEKENSAPKNDEGRKDSKTDDEKENLTQKNDKEREVSKAKNEKENFAPKFDTLIQTDANLSVPKQFTKSRFRPTHFLALRLLNPEIRKNVDLIQENILNINKDFRAGFINTNFLYSTLAVMELNDEEQLHKALKSVELSLDKIQDVYQKCNSKSIEFETLGSFKDQFLFMNMKETDSLTMLRSIVLIIKERMLARDISIRKDMFSPHSTILKLRNRFTLKRKGIKRIPSSLYEEQKNDYFGEELVTELLFCSLHGKKEGEFHKVIGTIDLKNNKLL